MARKGGPLHRRVGQVYVGAMMAVALTALVIAGWRFVQELREQPLALFFTYLAVMAAASASWAGGCRARRRVPGPTGACWTWACPRWCC